MENKELVSSGKISQYLIGYWLLWGLLFGFIYSIFISLITRFMESIIVKAIIAIILQGVIALIVWKLSTASAFKKRTIAYDDVPNVIRNLIIFTIVICVIIGINTIVSANSSMNESINSDYKLKYSESVLSRLYSEEEMAEYYKEKDKIIKEAKNKVNTYVIILDMGLTVVYLAVLAFERKEIMKYVG